MLAQWGGCGFWAGGYWPWIHRPDTHRGDFRLTGAWLCGPVVGVQTKGWLSARMRKPTKVASVRRQWTWERQLSASEPHWASLRPTEKELHEEEMRCLSKTWYKNKVEYSTVNFHTDYILKWYYLEYSRLSVSMGGWFQAHSLPLSHWGKPLRSPLQILEPHRCSSPLYKMMQKKKIKWCSPSQPSASVDTQCWRYNGVKIC